MQAGREDGERDGAAGELKRPAEAGAAKEESVACFKVGTSVNWQSLLTSRSYEYRCITSASRKLSTTPQLAVLQCGGKKRLRRKRKRRPDEVGELPVVGGPPSPGGTVILAACVRFVHEEVCVYVCVWCCGVLW